MKTPPRSLPLRLAAACLAASALATTASQATPLVTFDVIAVPVGLTGSSTTGLVISPDGLSVQFVSGTHANVLLQLVATVNGQDAILNNEGFTRAIGSFVSFGTTGNLSGAMRGGAATDPGVNNVNPFRSTLTGQLATSGTNAELTGLLSGYIDDAILDVGGTGTSIISAPNRFPGYFQAQYDIVSANVGPSFILGETILSLDGTAGSTSIRFVPRVGVGGLAALNRGSVQFTLDGVTLARNGDGSSISAPDPTAFAFHSVTVSTVPEPGAIGMLLGGALALGLRRTRRA